MLKREDADPFAQFVCGKPAQTSAMCLLNRETELAASSLPVQGRFLPDPQ